MGISGPWLSKGFPSTSTTLDLSVRDIGGWPSTDKRTPGEQKPHTPPLIVLVLEATLLVCVLCRTFISEAVRFSSTSNSCPPRVPNKAGNTRSKNPPSNPRRRFLKLNKNPLQSSLVRMAPPHVASGRAPGAVPGAVIRLPNSPRCPSSAGPAADHGLGSLRSSRR